MASLAVECPDEAGPGRPVADGRASPGLRLRLRVWLTSARLDRKLAAGARADESAALALRARQLTAHHMRARIAQRLFEVVAHAERRGGTNIWSAAIAQREAILDGREALLGLAERLRGPAPPDPGGVVLAFRLILAPVSPLYSACPDQSVHEAVWSVADALVTRS